MSDNIFKVRCRGVILHEGKLLLVTHPERNFSCLPGGHLEAGEDPLTCISREIIEELGVTPTVGNLLYVHTFTSSDKQTVEFHFHITNGKDFLNCEQLDRTHAHEIESLAWVRPNDDVRILPEQFASDFHNGTINLQTTKFITD